MHDVRATTNLFKEHIPIQRMNYYSLLSRAGIGTEFGAQLFFPFLIFTGSFHFPKGESTISPLNQISIKLLALKLPCSCFTCLPIFRLLKRMDNLTHCSQAGEENS